MIKINIKGMKAVEAMLDKAVKDGDQKLKNVLVKFGTDVETDAKLKAPADEGKLRNSINSTYDNRNKTVRVTVAANYAPFLEFGTRKFAATYVSTLPADWQNFAATFKGEKDAGTFYEFVDRLTKWILRKGLVSKTYNVKTRKSTTGKQSKATTAKADAYALAKYLLIKGIKPQPFLYPAVKKYTPDLQAGIDKIFT